MHLEPQLYSNPKLLIFQIKLSPNLIRSTGLLQNERGKLNKINVKSVVFTEVEFTQKQHQAAFDNYLLNR